MPIIKASSNAISIEPDITLITMEQVPYGYKTSNGELNGVFYDILNRIVKDSGINKQSSILSTKRVIAALSSQRSICSLTANTPDAIAQLDLIEPIGYPMNAGVIPKKGIELEDYDSLKNIIIAVPLGLYFNDKFNNDHSLSIVYPRNYVNAVKMLEIGQVDAIAGAVSTFQYIGAKQGISTKEFGQPLLFSQNEVYLVCTHGIDKSIRKKLKNTVITLKSTGEIKKIINSYLYILN